VVNNFDFSGWFFEHIFRYRNKCNVLLFNSLIHFFCYVKGIKVGEKVIFNGFPLLLRCENSKIQIGNNCVFNSSKHSVSAGVQKPCGFVTLREGAEIIIGNNSGATGSTILAALKIVIGNHVMIGAHSMILDNDYHNSDPNKRLSENVTSRPIIIEDDVFIGTNCMILKGVRIGKNSVIGANSVVINSIPPNSIAIGNPCKVVIIKKWDTPQK
jgi:acetyltransferase-like isoleucine patch superfamily enzyme